jgi:hypothetical protein
VREKGNQILQTVDALYLAMCKKKSNSLHADLQKSSLARAHVLDRELAAQLDAGLRAAPSRRRLLHRIFDAVVQLFALQHPTNSQGQISYFRFNFKNAPF